MIFVPPTPHSQPLTPNSKFLTVLKICSTFAGRFEPNVSMEKIKFTNLLTRDECQAMKGLAILSIVIHNLCHWTALRQGTNEFGYWQACADLLRQYLHQPDGNWFIVLMSFLGQYGVQTFLFLSGYGLVLKYERGNGTGVNRFQFVGEHYIKLFRLMLIPLAVTWYIAYTWGARGFDPTVMTSWKWICAQVFMYNNVMPNPTMNIFPGPYWFLGLMVQLYIIYSFILWVKPSEHCQWRGWVLPIIFLVACWYPQVNMAHEGADCPLITVRYNFPVAGIPFSLGLLCARYLKIPKFRHWWSIIISHAWWAGLMAVGVYYFFNMQFEYEKWLWAGLPYTLALMGLVRALGPWLIKPMVWVGIISSAMFVVHPALRILADNYLRANEITDPGAITQVLIYYTVASIAVAACYNFLLRLIPSTKWVTKYNGKQ